MDANLLSDVIRNIRADNEHLNDRRIFHENYEWLEGYWKDNFNGHNGSINDFISHRGVYFWNLLEVRNIAKGIASIECVGSNRHPDLLQNQEIANATMYLRYYCNLFEENIPSCEEIRCREHKRSHGLCLQRNGLLWHNTYNEVFAFKAVMFIVRQVRNNLFHGQKLTIEPVQFARNRVLVKLCASLTNTLLLNLLDSERISPN